MSSIAGSPPKDVSTDTPRDRDKPWIRTAISQIWTAISGIWKAICSHLHPIHGAAALVGLVGVFGGQMVAQRTQNHAKSLEVKTTLATDMSKSFTMAVGAGQRVASGLIYDPTGNRRQNAAAIQGAYNGGLGRWQVDAGRIGAELAARYKQDPIVGEWRRYRLAVTRFYRLSALVPGDERRAFVRGVRLYLERMRGIEWAASAVPGKRTVVNWKALRQVRNFKKSRAFRRTYDKVSATFLSLGDAFVQEALNLQPEV
jgi:hypothetical protein